MIAANSTIALASHVAAGGVVLDRGVVALVAALGILGSALGVRLAPHLPARALQRGVALLLVAVGALVAWRA